MEQRGKDICGALAYFNIDVNYSISPTQELILYDDDATLHKHTHNEIIDNRDGRVWEKVSIDYFSLIRREIGAQRTVDFKKRTRCSIIKKFDKLKI